jgi:probable rRNA maturation factor
MTELELQITGEVPAGLDLEPAQKVFLALVQALPERPGGIVNVAFVDDARGREINREYSGNDYATDVLSFSYIEDGGEPIEDVIGEIAVSYETAERQAKAAGTSLAEEAALLIVHGVLHIMGWDHQSEADQERMQALQKELMTSAGYHYREFKWED